MTKRQFDGAFESENSHFIKVYCQDKLESICRNMSDFYKYRVFVTLLVSVTEQMSVSKMP